MIKYISKQNRTCIPDMEKYPSGRRGAPAKGVVRVSVARVQIPLSPPIGIKFEHRQIRYIFVNGVAGIIVEKGDR